MAKKELVKYSSGFGDQMVIVDPATGQIMARCNNGMHGNDVVYSIFVNESTGTIGLTDYDKITAVYSIRGGDALIAKSLTNAADTNWNTLFADVAADYPSGQRMAVVDDTTAYGITKSSAGDAHYPFSVNLQTGVYTLGPSLQTYNGGAWNGTEHMVALNGKAYIGVLGGNLVELSMSGATLVVTPVYTGGVVDLGVNSTALVVEGTTYALLDPVGFTLLVDLPKPLIQSGTLAQFTPDPSNRDINGITIIGTRAWCLCSTELSARVICGVLLTDVTDIVVITPAPPTGADAPDYGVIPIIHSAVALSSGDFVVMAGSLIWVVDATGAFVRTLPSNKVLPMEEPTYAGSLVLMDVYSVTGTVSPTDKVVLAIDPVSRREIARTTSSGGAFTLRVLGSDPITLECLSGNSENAQVRDNVTVTLEP